MGSQIVHYDMNDVPLNLASLYYPRTSVATHKADGAIWPRSVISELRTLRFPLDWARYSRWSNLYISDRENSTRFYGCSSTSTAHRPDYLGEYRNCRGVTLNCRFSWRDG
jgi:hypothetical protein